MNNIEDMIVVDAISLDDLTLKEIEEYWDNYEGIDLELYSKLPLKEKLCLYNSFDKKYYYFKKRENKQELNGK
jgi:hypothetical protein